MTLENVQRAALLFPLDHRIREAPANLVTQLHRFVDPLIAAEIIEDALQDDPYNRAFLYNAKAFREMAKRQ